MADSSYVPHQGQRDTTQYREHCETRGSSEIRKHVDDSCRSQGACERAAPHDVEPQHDTEELAQRAAHQTLRCRVAAVQFICVNCFDQKSGKLRKSYDTHPDDEETRESPPPLCFGVVAFADRPRASVKNVTVTWTDRKRVKRMSDTYVFGNLCVHAGARPSTQSSPSSVHSRLFG